MHVKLGDLEKKIRVNLQDRGRFHYSMILGKNFLKHGALVASETNYIVTKKTRLRKIVEPSPNLIANTQSPL